MVGKIPFAVISLLFLGSTIDALIVWKTRTVNVCRDHFALVCSPSTELVIRNATYRAEGCSCESCQQTPHVVPGTQDLEKACNGKKICEADLKPFTTASCDCLNKFVDVQYGCVKRLRQQQACGQHEFKAEGHGFVTNHKYPEPSELRHCSVIFKVGMENHVAIRPMLLELPTTWSAHFCNLTGCEQILHSSIEQIVLKGNSHIKMVAQGTQVKADLLSVKFSFEYEVIDITTTIRQEEKKKTPTRETLQVGVLKTKSSSTGSLPKTGAIVAGVTVPTLLIAIFAGVYIYKTRGGDEEEEKLAGDDGSSSGGSEVYYKDVLRHRSNLEPVKNNSTA